MQPAELISAWRATIQASTKSWVLFEHGTCVILMEPDADLAAQAVSMLREWGPVHPGSSFGDFSTITLDNGLGWVVTSHHNDILTFVSPDEVGPDANDIVIGLTGRAKRAQDADSLQVIHIEDNTKS